MAAWHLDHHANLKLVVERMAFGAACSAFIDDLQAAPHLVESGDHRNIILTFVPTLDRRMARSCFENIEIFETKTNRAPAKKRIEFFVAIFNAVRNLVAPEVKGAYDQRIWRNSLSDGSVDSNCSSSVGSAV